jgi:hypothetical protein
MRPCDPGLTADHEGLGDLEEPVTKLARKGGGLPGAGVAPCWTGSKMGSRCWVVAARSLW